MINKDLSLKIVRIIKENDYEEINTPLGPLDIPFGYMREEEKALYSLWLRIDNELEKIISSIDELEIGIKELSQTQNNEISGLLSSKVYLKDIYWQQADKIASDQPVLAEKLRTSLNTRLGKGDYYCRENFLIVGKIKLTVNWELIYQDTFN